MILWDAHTHKCKNDAHSVYNAELSSPVEGYFSAGIHPWNADSVWNEKMLKHSLSNKLCLALGEVGLDKIKGPELSIQLTILEKQLEINEAFQLPVVLHNVRATNEILALKKNFPQQQWVIHDFQKIRTYEALEKEGIGISIGKSILYRGDLQDFVNQLPVDKFLLESDEFPDDLHRIYHKVSELKNLSLLNLRDQIGQNFKQIFSRW